MSSPRGNPSGGEHDARPVSAEELLDTRVLQSVAAEVAKRELIVITACKQPAQQELTVACDAVGYAEHLADVVADPQGF